MGVRAVASDEPRAAARPRVRLGALARRRLHWALVYALLIGFALLFMLPFSWMVTTSLKPEHEVFHWPPDFLPSTFMWQNYVTGWTELPFTRFLINSVVITGLAVAGNLVSCTLPAYAFARLRARGRNLMFGLMLATMMIPFEITLVPTFVLYAKLHLVNTYVPLILPAWLGSAFSIFLLRQFFLTIPRDLTDAARIDGASELRILWSVMLPLSKPALATVSIFAFVANWNNLLGPLIYLRSEDMFTLPLGLTLLHGPVDTGGSPQYAELMAVSILTMLPILLIFFVAQKYFVRGITLTGLGGR